jgi:hypothetical protein
MCDRESLFGAAGIETQSFGNESIPVISDWENTKRLLHRIH